MPVQTSFINHDSPKIGKTSYIISQAVSISLLIADLALMEIFLVIL